MPQGPSQSQLDLEIPVPLAAPTPATVTPYVSPCSRSQYHCRTGVRTLTHMRTHCIGQGEVRSLQTKTRVGVPQLNTDGKENRKCCASPQFDPSVQDAQCSTEESHRRSVTDTRTAGTTQMKRTAEQSVQTGRFAVVIPLLSTGAKHAVMYMNGENVIKFDFFVTIVVCRQQPVCELTHS